MALPSLVLEFQGWPITGLHFGRRPREIAAWNASVHFRTQLIAFVVFPGL
jgi:hypothetical protein